MCVSNSETKPTSSPANGALHYCSQSPCYYGMCCGRVWASTRKELGKKRIAHLSDANNILHVVYRRGHTETMSGISHHETFLPVRGPAKEPGTCGNGLISEEPHTASKVLNQETPNKQFRCYSKSAMLFSASPECHGKEPAADKPFKA